MRGGMHRTDTLRKRKMHIAIPQIMSMMTYTLYRPKKGFPRNLAYGYDITAAGRNPPNICKICEKFATGIDVNDWNAAQLDCKQREWEKINIWLNGGGHK
jgi:hypothetical protein